MFAVFAYHVHGIREGNRWRETAPVFAVSHGEETIPVIRLRQTKRTSLCLGLPLEVDIMSLTTPDSNLYLAWKKFIETGEISENINPEITDAWKRCAAAGVDPLAGRSQFILDNTKIRDVLEDHQELIDLARPFMNNLYKFVAGSGFIVLLCDEHGYSMATIGEPDVNGDTDELNFQTGALWTEEEIGNNGVGTSLVMRRPFQVTGFEHFCRKHHKWTCSGSPIFNENSEMIGILLSLIHI